MSILGSIDALLAFSPPPGGAEGQSPFGMLIPMVAIIAVFYFLVIAPQRKRQKKHAETLANLKNGDKVVTQGGIHGTVAGVSDTVVQLRIADGVKIEIAKHAISDVRHEGESQS
ncbi:MAG: preprotein translocase subunit YajC [Acidobacteriota bacterium]|nr:preprotein translocase subunit YajC [Acidobacteriota bacterium]